MDRAVAWRAALLQALLLTAVALALAAALPRSFFEDWGWLAGPGAWGACALATAAVLRLPAVPVLGGAAVAGLPMLLGVAVGVHWLGVAVGVHWLGAPLGVAVLAAWCGRLSARGPGARTAVTA